MAETGHSQKEFAKTATLPPCSCPWQFINSPGVQTLRESRGNWQITGPSLPETINQPDALDDPTPTHLPQGLAGTTLASGASGSSGVTGVSGCPPMGPYFFPYPQTYRRPNSEGLLIAPNQDSSDRPPQASATGTRMVICGVLCPWVITRTDCPPAAPDIPTERPYRCQKRSHESPGTIEGTIEGTFNSYTTRHRRVRLSPLKFDKKGMIEWRMN
jgi:hypothetical protein